MDFSKLTDKQLAAITKKFLNKNIKVMKGLFCYFYLDDNKEFKTKIRGSNELGQYTKSHEAKAIQRAKLQLAKINDFLNPPSEEDMNFRRFMSMNIYEAAGYSKQEIKEFSSPQAFAKSQMTKFNNMFNEK